MAELIAALGAVSTILGAVKQMSSAVESIYQKVEEYKHAQERCNELLSRLRQIAALLASAKELVGYIVMSDQLSQDMARATKELLHIVGAVDKAVARQDRTTAVEISEAHHRQTDHRHRNSFKDHVRRGMGAMRGRAVGQGNCEDELLLKKLHANVEVDRLSWMAYQESIKKELAHVEETLRHVVKLATTEQRYVVVCKPISTSRILAGGRSWCVYRVADLPQCCTA